MPAVSPRRTLRVLHVEDSPDDHDLAMAHLARAGHRLDALRVDTEAGFATALAERGRDWDVVLSDFKLPGFTGLRAQQILKDSGCDLPFILVSGEIGEDTAVAAMRNGASDYLLKNNLSRLAPAVEHAIEAHQERLARRQADRELAASRQRLRELAQHLQTSIEMERAAIAREIHDDVGGSLTAIKFDLAWIARHVDLPEVQQRVATALDTVAHAVDASQRIMLNLRPAILEQGLVPALQWMAQQFEKRNAIACRVHAPGEGGGLGVEGVTLPAGVPLVAYRFAQEALTNVAKHAQASQVGIDLALSGGVLSLEVADNGRGLTRADLAKARSFGLRGLQERAGTVGGWVDISARPGGGTVLLLSVPLPGAGNEAGFDPDDEEDPTEWGTP